MRLTGILFIGLASYLLLAGCKERKGVVIGRDFAVVQELRTSDLTLDQQNALSCALQVGREEKVLANSILVSVVRGPKIAGEPPDWRTGDEWAVRFVDREIATLPPGTGTRDGGFAILVRIKPCRLLHVLVPG